jgi:hypothetical protein
MLRERKQDDGNAAGRKMQAKGPSMTDTNLPNVEIETHRPNVETDRHLPSAQTDRHLPTTHGPAE